ncbi:hypothetical protein AC630_12670 [Bradyrhizobium sp. AS23.2]|nr:hypothetical protein AC630_12670 [Bradyrhizobium sp. AS23.2]
MVSGPRSGGSFRLRKLLVASIALLASCDVIAEAQQRPSHEVAQAPKPANIDRNGVLTLVRGTLLALDHANKTGNYTVLRDLGAPAFYVGNSAARLSEIFAKLRNDKLDLSGVAVIDPQLSLLPQIETNGMMRMAGFFPSVPSQVNFELMYVPVDSQWRLFGISVAVGQSGPVPPPSEPPNSPAKRSATEKKLPSPQPSPK